MALTPKERTRAALQRETVDRLPTQISYTGDMGRRLAAHLGVSLDQLPQRLDNHLLRVDLTYPQRLNADGAVRYDWWGVGWSTESEGYLPVHSPLAAAARPDLDDYPWPDPDDPHLLDEAAQAMAAHGSRYFVVPNLGFCLFERAWALRGFEGFLMDLALDPGFASGLLDRITAIQEILLRRYLALGVDGGYFGDDYGAQKGMLFAPQTWRALFKPRLARLFALCREAGRPVILHSDGQIEAILPDLVEIGLTALNPVQPEILDHGRLQRTYGHRLAFYGGVSTQTVLPGGTPAEVAAAVAQCVAGLAPEGTGLLLGPSHRMMSDIPMSNVDALLAAMQIQGK